VKCKLGNEAVAAADFNEFPPDVMAGITAALPFTQLLADE
jgi:hypothetical protein